MGEPKPKPIIMDGESVRAILAGTKTQTRRIPAYMRECRYIGGREEDHNDPALWGWADIDGCWHVLDQSAEPYYSSGAMAGTTYRLETRFKVGQTLYVKETWAEMPGEMGLTGFPIYRAGRHDLQEQPARWRSPLYMPRWASRLTLRVTEVRIQRVQDICKHPDDIIAEGVGTGPVGDLEHACELINAFKRRWDAINGKHAPWASNPWVEAVTFERVDGPA